MVENKGEYFKEIDISFPIADKPVGSKIVKHNNTNNKDHFPHEKKVKFTTYILP